MLKLTSLRKSGLTHYEQYLAEGGRSLTVRITLPEDYVATKMPCQDDYVTGAIPKCPAHKHQRLLRTWRSPELEEGNIADEVYRAWQAHDEELFTWMKHQEEDLKEQERRKWEEETWQWELRKKKEEEEAKK